MSRHSILCLTVTTIMLIAPFLNNYFFWDFWHLMWKIQTNELQFCWRLGTKSYMEISFCVCPSGFPLGVTGSCTYQRLRRRKRELWNASWPSSCSQVAGRWRESSLAIHTPCWGWRWVKKHICCRCPSHAITFELTTIKCFDSCWYFSFVPVCYRIYKKQGVK